MESSMIFDPGKYYVGDPGFALPLDDLRMLFARIIRNKVKTGTLELIDSKKIIVVDNEIIEILDSYWFTPMPNYFGTLYDQNGKGYGFEWGVFGVIPWKWTSLKNLNEQHFNAVEFEKPFECFCDNQKILIGDLTFTFSKQNETI